MEYHRVKKVGITFGAFDLFHAGHILMLQEAKTVCDHLIVCIQTDPSLDRNEKNAPVQSIVERQIQVTACKYVDEIIVYDTEKDVMVRRNVWEWCQDASNVEEGLDLVLRRGCRSVLRGDDRGSLSVYEIGFRPVWPPR